MAEEQFYKWNNLNLRVYKTDTPFSDDFTKLGSHTCRKSFAYQLWAPSQHPTLPGFGPLFKNAWSLEYAAVCVDDDVNFGLVILARSIRRLSLFLIPKWIIYTKYSQAISRPSYEIGINNTCIFGWRRTPPLDSTGGKNKDTEKTKRAL